MITRTHTPLGPFDLANQNRHFNPWPELADGTVVMAFPGEDGGAPVAVTLRDAQDGTLALAAHGPGASEAALDQALAGMSLDVDARGWPELGERHAWLGAIQRERRFLRPTLFQSPYEAAAAFVIGHRISVDQTRVIRARMAEAYGAHVEVAGRPFATFPPPAALAELTELPGTAANKLERLRAIGAAAQAGWLTRAALRDQPEADALAQLQTLPGIGPFFATGILYRGAGVPDGLLTDPVTLHAAGVVSGQTLTADGLRELAEAWRPYRAWCATMLHVWARSTGNMPARPGRGGR